MRVRLTDGQREVEIRTEGNDPRLLRQIERTARRLLVDLAPQTDPSTFGFGRHLDLDRVALDSTIERADQDDEPDLDDEDDEA